MNKKKVLIFAPHPDDETFGCGGTIAKRINEGYEVLIVIMTDGRHAFQHVFGIDVDPTPEELKEIRKEEVRRATKILGVPEENLIFLDFVDGTLKNNMEKAEEKVAEILSKNYPVEVYFPCGKDGNPDHRAANLILKNAIKKLGISSLIYQYSITHKYSRIGPILDAFLSFFKRNMVRIDISNFLITKEAACKEFRIELTPVSNKQHRPLVHSIKRFLKSNEVFLIERKNKQYNKA